MIDLINNCFGCLGVFRNATTRSGIIKKTELSERIVSKRKEFNSTERHWGVLSEEIKLPIIPSSAKVLDVGSGSGIISKRMHNELGCDVYAIEPGIEACNSGNIDPFEESRKNLGVEKVEKLTLQEAVKREKYIQNFDVVTVYKYNVPLNHKEEFCAGLAQSVKPDGVVYVHSVEKERLFLSEEYRVMYLVDELKKHFHSVTFTKREYGRFNDINDGMITCRIPKTKWDNNHLKTLFRKRSFMTHIF